MPDKTPCSRLLDRYEDLKRSLLNLGPIAHGSIWPRTIRRKDSRGRMRTFGPYYQWTKKEKARTVLVNLSASEAKVYGRAIREHRKMERILAKMRATSLKILELAIKEGREKASGM
ncbi:MAG: hypothetical protein NTX50_21655 [Candidatus Sumerlaeota bacterium]|nr:hypothetical protein [Candidatus Sumerlaeota bacterium]